MKKSEASFVVLVLWVIPHSSCILGLNPDATLLLSFKASIIVKDPFSLLHNWTDDKDLSGPCSWAGVTCSKRSFRVISLELSHSGLVGPIPQELGYIPHLKTLDLSANFLNGTLPESLARMKGLRLLNLSGNCFSGAVPGGFKSVEVLDLSSNLLTGWGGVFAGENLRYVNLSSNRISGLIPPGFAEGMPGNATVDLSFNDLAGEIPAGLRNQKAEFFAGNLDLCGEPLKKLCTVPSTLYVPPNNVSKNTSSPAIAAIPKPIEDPNSAGEAQNPSRKQPKHDGLTPGAVAGIIIGDLAGLGAVALVFLTVYQLKNKKQGNEAKTKETNPAWLCLTSEANAGSDSEDNENEKEKDNKKQSSLVTLDGESGFELETLLKASAYMLGASGSSIVYKAVLEDGAAFAVRRIGETSVRTLKEFEHHVKAIAKMRHPNLVRVRGFYWGQDDKLVIYDYVSHGNLANVGFMSRKVGSSSPHHLAFEVRLKIAKCLARGIAFIHDKKHVHGNIKPSNILLTPEMEAVISDFGLQWLLNGKSNNCTKTADVSSGHFGSRRSMTTSYGGGLMSAGSSPAPCSSSGYRAPESLKDLKPSPKWDVYSFGVVLLELLTGKTLSDRDLSQWTTAEQGGGEEAENNKEWVMRMADVAVRDDVENREESTLALFALGFCCASLDPKKRPSMKDALHVLERIPC